VKFRRILVFVVFFKASKDWVDVAFINRLMAVNADLLAKLLVVSCTKSRYGCAIDTLELASWVVIIENIICWIFPVDPFAVAAFYNVNAIVLTIK
jgi:hypothetical protein